MRTEATIWRNRSEFPCGCARAQEFLERKWAKERGRRLINVL
ncbi:DUF1348 family protein [Rhizobium sp. SG_E_25_P2]|nr:DUF1348 family protein [Rhizobium sp. SG_E_25_P2]